VDKISEQAEAIRFFNFPYEAIEEALVNAVYHKSYQEQEPVEVRVYPSRIVILNYPGPLPPICEESMRKGKFDARKYRNPRMGDMFKELGLAEAKGSGVPKIKKELKANGSPKAEFNTDTERSYFETVLHIHPKFIETIPVIEVDGEQMDLFGNLRLVEPDKEILEFCKVPRSKKEILELKGVSNRTERFNTHILPLVVAKLIEPTIPETPTSPNQKYIITELGTAFLNAN
jgi:ATP-dependent DNA helicase RecG